MSVVAVMVLSSCRAASCHFVQVLSCTRRYLSSLRGQAKQYGPGRLLLLDGQQAATGASPGGEVLAISVARLVMPAGQVRAHTGRVLAHHLSCAAGLAVR